MHGYYHGGHNSKLIVQNVLKDVESRQIQFAEWEALSSPLLSTSTGSYLKPTTASNTLLETVLNHVFVDAVDWRKTRESLLECLRQNGDERRILCLGPGAGSLIPHDTDFTTTPHVKVVDNFMHLLGGPKDDDIAIVGLSSNFSCGNGLEEMWDTLQKGLSTATEV